MVIASLIRLFTQVAILIWFCCSCLQKAAADDIRIKYGSSSLDVRARYIENLMVRALRISQKEYGPFSINRLDIEIPSHWVLHALEEGKLINVSVAMTSNEWENKAIPIRIPVRRGIFKYRLLLVHKDNLKHFQKVANVQQLKELSVGLKRGWTTRTMLETLDFNIVEADSYDMIFEMLQAKGFDYTIRGIHEAFEEIRLRRRFYDDLTVEPNILLHMPAPSYFFVSPKYPRIAERLKYGLEKMVESGELKQLFEQAFSKYIDMLDLKNRRVIEVGNPLLPENTPLDRKELWFDYNLESN